MYTVADPDPNPKGGGQLTSATGEETLTPNPNEWNSTLTSGTMVIYPHRYILMLMSGVPGRASWISGSSEPYRD